MQFERFYSLNDSVVESFPDLHVEGNARANPDARFIRWLTLVSTGPTRPNRLEETLSLAYCYSSLSKFVSENLVGKLSLAREIFSLQIQA